MSTTTLLQRLLKDPLIHFLLIGACIYGAYGLLGDPGEDEDTRTVTITQDEIKSLTEQWTRLWNRPPTEAELAEVLRKHVRTRVLYQEALAMGLDQNDVVIERRLAQKVELLSRSLMVPDPPAEEELASWYAENSEEFLEPSTYTFSQVFFDPDRRGRQAGSDAEAALESLRALPEVPAELATYGDDGITGNYYAGRTELELRKILGGGFTDQLVNLEPGKWHGPVLSGFGVHLVYVHSVTEPEPRALDDIRDRVLEAWTIEQIEVRSTEFIDELIARYEIVVEETQVPMTVPPTSGQAGE